MEVVTTVAVTTWYPRNYSSAITRAAGEVADGGIRGALSPAKFRQPVLRFACLVRI